MSTFAELIDRVDASNESLMRIRETIIDENIDSTISIVDAIESMNLNGGLRSDIESGSQYEERLEGMRDEIEQASILESILFYVQGLYNTVNDISQNQEEGELFEFAKPVIGGYVAGETANVGDGGGRGFGGVKDLLGGFFKRLLGIAFAAFTGNELMRFFTDGKYGLADVPKLLSDYIDKQFENLEDQLTLDNLGSIISGGLDTAIRLLFGEGNIQSALTQAGVMGTLGYLFFGPLGLAVGAALGIVTGMISEDDVIHIKDNFVEYLGDWFDTAMEILNDGILEAISSESYKEAAADATEALASGNATLDDAAVGLFTYAEDATPADQRTTKKPPEARILERIQTRIQTKINEINEEQRFIDEVAPERIADARRVFDSIPGSQNMEFERHPLYNQIQAEITASRYRIDDLMSELITFSSIWLEWNLGLLFE